VAEARGTQTCSTKACSTECGQNTPAVCIDGGM